MLNQLILLESNFYLFLKAAKKNLLKIVNILILMMKKI